MTDDTPRDVSVDPLARLEQFLASDRVPDGCFRLSELDGFLTGVVVGPNPTPCEVWLPYVWGDGEPAFHDAEEARRIVSSIVARRDALMAALEDAPETYAPLLQYDADGRPRVEDWSRGFLEAVRLAPESWSRLLDGEDQHLILPIVVHWPRGALGRPNMRAAPEVQRAVMDLLTGLLPACVLEVHAYWAAARRAAAATLKASGAGEGASALDAAALSSNYRPDLGCNPDDGEHSENSRSARKTARKTKGGQA